MTTGQMAMRHPAGRLGLRDLDQRELASGLLLLLDEEWGFGDEPLPGCLAHLLREHPGGAVILLGRFLDVDDGIGDEVAIPLRVVLGAVIRGDDLRA